ncbi:hypothetical protein JNW90_24240 [Micromonospora sp. STR1s_5]|nr:hypothetical protein [Micromonospora sp. STR1s_5]
MVTATLTPQGVQMPTTAPTSTPDYFQTPVAELPCTTCGGLLHAKIRNGQLGWVHANPADADKGGRHTAFPAA